MSLWNQFGRVAACYPVLIGLCVCVVLPGSSLMMVVKPKHVGEF